MNTGERGQLGILTRAFATRLVEGETAQTSIAQVQFVIWTIALLTIPLLRVPAGAWRRYMMVAGRTPDLVDLATYSHKLFFLGYTVFVVGLVTLVIWDGIFPDRRDAWTFGTLPVRTRTLVAARLTAMFAVILVVVVGFSLPSLLLYAGAAGAYYGPLGVPRHVAGHLVSTLMAALTTFSAVILVQAIVLNVLSARWSGRAIALLQVAFVVAIVQSVFSFPSAARAAGQVALGTSHPSFAVPLWYLGLYESIAGSTRDAWGPAAAKAVALSAAVTAGALGAYALTYRRLSRRALEALELAGLGRTPRAIASSPRSAVRSFALTTLLRSRRHRLLLAVYFGVGVAIVLPEVLRAATESQGTLPPVRTLAMPLILIFFAVAGVRVIFAIPQDVGANWVFQLTETTRRDSYLSGAVEAAWLIAVVPVVLAMTPLLWHGWGPGAALTHAAICLVLGGLLVEAVIGPMKKIPFTCTYLPGRGNVRKWWPAYLFAFTTFTFSAAGVARQAIEHPGVAGVLLACALVGWLALRAWRFRLASRLDAFEYEEEPDDLVLRIDLAAARMAARAPDGASNA